MIGSDFCTQQDSCEVQLWTGGSPTQFRTARLSPGSSSGSDSAATTSPRAAQRQHFMEGLEDYLQYALLNLRFDDFNHLVDSALNTERKHLEMEDKKRKIVPVASARNTRPRLQQHQQYQQQYRPPQKYQPRPQQYPTRQ